MPCNKRPFDSPNAARAQLRVWQRSARRSALDTVHVYKCKDDPDHRGKFHVGHSPDRIKRKEAGRSFVKRESYDDVRGRVFGDLDDLFFAQEVRVKGKLNPRQREKNAGSFGDTSLIINNSLAQDDFDVENK